MRIRLSELAPAQKRKAWAAIQRDAPSLAEFMQSDTCKMLCEKLNMSVVIEVQGGKVITKKSAGEPQKNTEETAPRKVWKRRKNEHQT